MSETCGHRPCLCAVADEAGFCSDYCRKHTGETLVESCRCGHEACEAEGIAGVTSPSVPDLEVEE